MYLHGLGATSVASFLTIASGDELRARPAVFVDFLGFGLSDRPSEFGYTLVDHARCIAAVIDDLGAGAVDVVGHSLGGSVAIVLAHERPDLVERLVVIEPNLLPWDGDASVAIARQDEDEFVRTGFARLLTAADPTWAVTLRLADPRAVHRTAVGLCVGSDPVMADALADATAPRILVWGDRTPRPEVLDRLVDHGVALEVIADSGHVPMIDNPQGLTTALAGFLS